MSIHALTSLVCPLTAKRARRKQERPGELLEAALALFVAKGFAATRAEEVARQAGVSKGTLFLYFPSKEDLFKAVVRENLTGRFPLWDAEIDSFSGSSADLLKLCIHRWWTQVGSTRLGGIFKLVMSEIGNFPELADFYRDEVMSPGHTLIRRVLQRGVDRGEFRPIDLDAGVYAVVSLLVFLLLWEPVMRNCCPSDEALQPEPFLETQIQLLLHGLQQAPTPLQPTPSH
jgi:TetR/AcrR family transcriptional regulator